MIKIYMSPSCSSCRKVKAYFEENKIPFEEINILTEKISREELKDMLEKSLNGTDDIISTRSKIVKDKHPDFNSMTINGLIDFVIENPSVLKRPIIVDKDKIQVGYNADEIEIFRCAKTLADNTCKGDDCPNFAECMGQYSSALPEKK
ncbi:MAG: Spx/MgsR family RNA polymerase-binding regulatory protein [Bacilli bacterium]